VVEELRARHGVAAELHHHDRAPEALDVRQRLHQDVHRDGRVGPRADGRAPALAAHGYVPTSCSPVVSGSPSARLAHCTAAPEAPLPRLSIAAMASTVPVRWSTRAVRWAAFVPRVALVDGERSDTTTNGSSA